TMRSTMALFREGIAIPPRAARPSGVRPGRVGYVVSGSLPFQLAGYSVRTQELLSGMAQTGLDPLCFTQPGFPWDRPHLISEPGPVALERTIGPVRYIHTPWPENAVDPERAVESAAEVLATQFGAHGVETVQAASNSRNGLPALLAARQVGAPFV